MSKTRNLYSSNSSCSVPEPVLALLIHRARIRIVAIDEKLSLAVLVARGDPVVATAGMGCALRLKLVHHFLYCIEPVQDKVIAEEAPAGAFTSLDPDI